MQKKAAKWMIWYVPTYCDERVHGSRDSMYVPYLKGVDVSGRERKNADEIIDVVYTIYQNLSRNIHET